MKGSLNYSRLVTLFAVEYKEKETAFENSEFFKLTEEGSDESLLRALDLILAGEVDVGLVSSVEATRGWTYFHSVVDRYIQMKPINEERARLLIRAMYRLTLAGIDVNARDALSETALVKAAASADQALMNHLIRLGMQRSIQPILILRTHLYVYVYSPRR